MAPNGLALIGLNGLMGIVGLLVYFFRYNNPSVFVFPKEVREVEAGTI
jgi:hypothetical protein